jgi:ribosome-binding protein aMBF1 (putative translation factor)
MSETVPIEFEGTVMTLCQQCKQRGNSFHLGPEADASHVIRTMKRAARLETDSELAAFLGRKQSAISQWRKRGSVPEAAIIRFQIRASEQAR